MSATGKRFAKLLARAQDSGTLLVERAKLNYAVSLDELLKRAGLSQAEFARRANVSPAYVTKVLRGDTNYTVETMVKLADAAGGELCLHVAPKHADIRWMGVVRNAAGKGVHPWAHEGQGRHSLRSEVRDEDRRDVVAA